MATKTLAAIQEQIEKLTKQAEAIRAKEVAEVVAQIRSAIEHYGLTAADLGLGAAAKARKARVSVKKAGKKGGKKVGAVKFRDDQGNTWTGMGPKPRWFKEALAAGKSLESLTA